MILNTRRRRLNITKILPGVLIFYASVYFLWPAVSARYRGANWPFIRRYVPSDDILSHTQNETLGVSTLYVL